jgi:glycosidase
MLFDQNGNVSLTQNQVALYNRVRALTAIRAAHPALRHGVRKTLEAGADLWAFSMTSKEETVYVVVNRSDAPLSTCTLPAGNLHELVGNVTLAGPGVTIPARQARIFVAAP